MKILFYPDLRETEDDPSIETMHSKSLGTVLKALRKRPDLKQLVVETISSASKKIDLKSLEATGYVAHVSGNIYEFRIPPQKRGGVVRLYFGYKNSGTILVFSGEIKKIKSADQELIKFAQNKFNEVCKK